MEVSHTQTMYLNNAQIYAIECLMIQGSIRIKTAKFGLINASSAESQ